MVIESSDGNRLVNIGSYEVFQAMYSTIKVRLASKEAEIEKALIFLKEGVCQNKEALETARQFNLIRDYLSSIKPNDMVYDYENEDLKCPWLDKISITATSCSNMFITADGKDLLFEIVSILTYGFYLKSDILIVID